MPNDIDKVAGFVRNYFFAAKWHEIYDFVEFVLSSVADPMKANLCTTWNTMLERENAGYRIVGGQVTEITNESELAEVQEALVSNVEGVRRHIDAALALFSNRSSPDYRNSIKESISAVEAICRALAGDSGTTLGAALNSIQAKLGMHGALKSALSSLYGYTSDEHGIRHAMLEEPNLGSAEAKFMLVVCSAFANYIIAKAAAAKLKV